MNIQRTSIEGLVIITPDVHWDGRGYFFESYNYRSLKDLIGLQAHFVQDNESSSSYGVVRGLHYQDGGHSQMKLVRVIRGEVYDVAVDLRPDSPTFGDWVGVRLSSQNGKQLLIPKGFAHGFSVLSEEAVFAYKCDDYYSPNHEKGIKYNDTYLNIDWKLPEEAIKVSEKDSLLPGFMEVFPNINDRKQGRGSN